MAGPASQTPAVDNKVLVKGDGDATVVKAQAKMVGNYNVHIFYAMVMPRHIQYSVQTG